ncbi:MAG TPA: ThuA domain-containing protein [Methylomirabilota bacterium]|nr:ThuA domain-containing protein [Methylomirabilota bacterium]
MKKTLGIAFAGIVAALALVVTAFAADSAAPIKTLIVGGGSSHDFNKWFRDADLAILSGPQFQAKYTDQVGTVTEQLGGIDVLYLSNNQPFTNAATRSAIFDFANSGKGLVLVHPALWYNWRDWPEYNQKLVGGGARSHDKYGEFEVTIDQPDHPVVRGLPKTFRIKDELYHFQKDINGSAFDVLATGRNLETGKTYPVVWVTKHPKARIVCITLGHDGEAHQHEAWKPLLKNAVGWAAAQK